MPMSEITEKNRIPQDECGKHTTDKPQITRQDSHICRKTYKWELLLTQACEHST